MLTAIFFGRSSDPPDKDNSFLYGLFFPKAPFFYVLHNLFIECFTKSLRSL